MYYIITVLHSIRKFIESIIMFYRKSANVKAQVCAPEPDMGGNTQENTQAADMELEESVRSNQQFIVPGTTS